MFHIFQYCLFTFFKWFLVKVILFHLAITSNLFCIAELQHLSLNIVKKEKNKVTWGFSLNFPLDPTSMQPLVNHTLNFWR